MLRKREDKGGPNTGSDDWVERGVKAGRKEYIL
jgi:hypothetical protein